MHAKPSTLSPGQLVSGRYRIDTSLGHGGFGSVYSATQVDTGRAVALKLLHRDLVDDELGVKRFDREAGLAERLTHPNAVRIFDHGRADDGSPFIVFELLKGRPLDDVLRAGGALPAARVARIAAQVLKVLMEAHAQGIVHRDIKPSNLMLCDFSGEPDFVKVLDFGIAKAPLADGRTATGLTREGQIVGTPSYMAPEQVTGASVTPATDLYALGLVMSEALSGRVVFGDGSGMQICIAQVSPSPVPHAPGVLASPLGQVVARATQKDVAARYGSAEEMLRELEAASRDPATAPTLPAALPATYAFSPQALPAAVALAGVPGGGWAHAPAPAVAAPAYAAPAVRAPRGGGIVWLIVVGGLVLVAAVGLVAFLAGRASGIGGDSSASEPTPTPTPTAATIKPTAPASPPASPTATPTTAPAPPTGPRPVPTGPNVPVPPIVPTAVPFPAPTPNPTPVPPPTTTPTPTPTKNTCGCAPGDLQCAMKCSSSRK